MPNNTIRQHNNSKYLPIILILIVVFVFFLNINCSLAQRREFEVEYPEIPGAPLEETTPPHELLPDYILYLFYFGIAIVFLAVFGSLVFGGFLYITSAGKPELRRKAKDQIFAAFLGLIIMLTSYLVITTINPQLKILKMRELEPVPETPTIPSEGGVYVYERENCRGEPASRLRQSAPDLGDLSQRIKSIRIVNDPSVSYGYVIFSDKNYKGLGFDEIEEDCHKERPPNSSIIIFERTNLSGGEIIFYRNPFYKEEGGEFKVNDREIGSGAYRKIFGSPIVAGEEVPRFKNIPDSNCWCEDLQIGNPQENCYYKNYDYKECNCIEWDLEEGVSEGDYCIKWERPTLAEKGISSIKINGDYVVRLYSTIDVQVFPTQYDINREGPKQVKWEYIRGIDKTGKPRYPRGVTIYRGKIIYPPQKLKPQK